MPVGPRQMLLFLLGPIRPSLRLKTMLFFDGWREGANKQTGLLPPVLAAKPAQPDPNNRPVPRLTLILLPSCDLFVGLSSDLQKNT